MRAHGRVGASAYTINLFPPPFLSPSLLCRRAKRGRGVGRETFCHACVPPLGGQLGWEARLRRKVFSESSHAKIHSYYCIFYRLPAVYLKRKSIFANLLARAFGRGVALGWDFPKGNITNFFRRKKFALRRVSSTIWNISFF